MSDKELREAAEWYEQEGRGRSWYKSARTLAEWATSELSRRDAEAAERAKPINVQQILAIAPTLFNHCYCLADGAYEITANIRRVVKTQGDLNDLISTLKGGGA